MDDVNFMQADFLPSFNRELDSLLKAGQPLTFRKGQVLIYEGHLPYGIFVLQSGKVEFYREGILCQEGHLQSSHQGPVIGLDCFLKDKPCCCTCQAAEDCQVIFISKTQLMQRPSAS